MDEYRVASAPLTKILRETGLASSGRDAQRLVEQGSVQIDGERLTDDRTLEPGTYVLQVGKRRWARVVVG
jgi:tyrosyl-tRNA synthetase